MTPDWNALRATYPALRKWTYFNTATYGLLSEQTTAAVNRHFAHRDQYACADHVHWFDDIDRTREKVARLIGATAADIGFMANAATALSLFLNGIDWRPGDQVVTLTDEFPNQIYHASLLKDVELVEVDGERLYDAVNARTRAVLMSQVNYSTGYRPPIEQIGPWLSERGVPLYLDATQALGALTLDVAKAQPAMVSVHGYKWLLSPNGAAFFYVSPELRERLEPRVYGWRSHEDWRNVDRLHHGAPVLIGAAERYEGGMPAFPNLYAMDEAVERFLDIGPAVIEKRVLELSALLQSKLEALGGVRILHRDSPITAAVFEKHAAGELAAALHKHRIVTAARHSALRISVQFYNNEADVERLIHHCRMPADG
ncbi:MAG: aminotransferase class V-fold PLP-dependent enzyme [Acidobacteria bacterium]|nr:aminotransferase class V-fold PLP-dependent enzyme [Acidobacteriota bacterium]